jgi:hypothetical protein
MARGSDTLWDAVVVRRFNVRHVNGLVVGYFIRAPRPGGWVGRYLPAKAPTCAN